MNIPTSPQAPIDPGDDLAFLSSIPLFQEIPPHDLKFLVRLLRQATFSAGTVIFAQGSLTSDLVIVKNGIVSVFLTTAEQQNIELTRLGPGSYFGEMAVFDDYPRSAGVLAVTDVWLCGIERDAFRSFVRFHPATLFQMCKVFSHRVRNTNSKLSRH